MVFGCLGLLVLSLMAAAVGMVAIVWRAASEELARPALVQPMDPGWPPPPAPAPLAPAPAPVPTPEPLADPTPIDPSQTLGGLTADQLGIAGPTEPEPEVEPIPSVPIPALSRTIIARVTQVRGIDSLRRGAACEFDVDRVDLSPDGTSYRCRTRVMCGDVLIYGGPSSGYFDCTLEPPPSLHVRGEDTATSASDTDGAFAIDSAAGTFRVRDDSSGPNGELELIARITRVE